MRQTPRRLEVWIFAVLFALALSGCGPTSPEAKVTAARAEYTVRLENFTVREPEVEEMMPEMEEGEDGEPMAAEEAASSEEMAASAEGEMAAEGMEMAEGAMEEETGPRTVDVILHLLVRFGGDKALPGITVEVTQKDPFGEEKEPTLHWIETDGMIKSDVRQVDLVLESVEFQDGDAFSVLLREVVPENMRSQYREFSGAGS